MSLFFCHRVDHYIGRPTLVEKALSFPHELPFSFKVNRSEVRSQHDITYRHQKPL